MSLADPASTGWLSDRARRRVAWAVPALVTAAVAVGATLASGPATGASPKLPPRTAAQLLTAVQGSDVTALSGVVRETANLGIPSLPGSSNGASLSWQTFIAGSHSARVWADGPHKQRVALIGELSEADVVHNGADLWTYTSNSNTVTHTVLPKSGTQGSKHAADAGHAPDARDLTPAAVSARVLKSISPSTTVSVNTSRMVADQAAYTLVLRPRDANSTVSKVTIAIDAKKFVPLQVQVFGRSSALAFETGFTHISYATPPASIFAFRAPKGATTSTSPFGSKRHHGDRDGARQHGQPATAPVSPTKPATRTHDSKALKVIGSGWTSVLEMGSGSSIVNSLPHGLTNPVGSSGTRLLHTALVNVVFLPDGRTFAGAVSPSYLEHVAATTPR